MSVEQQKFLLTSKLEQILNIIKEDVKSIVCKRYNISANDFESYYKVLPYLPSFGIHENIDDIKINSLDEQKKEILQKIILVVSEYLLKAIFDVMLIKPDSHTEKTPYRVAKSWIGTSRDDFDELMSGRFVKEPDFVTFPSTKNNSYILKKMELTSVCSHHLLPFSTKFSTKSFLVIAYKPNDKIVGLSKLTRYIRDYIGRRGWVQEELVNTIYDKLMKKLEPMELFIGLFEVKHTCEFIRGAQDNTAGFTTYKTSNNDILNYVFKTLHVT